MSKAAPGHLTEDQSAVLGFLASPAAYGLTDAKIKRIDTHGSIVFLAGERVYKVKRAVRFPYMDYGTLERRRWACEREVAINRRTAPEIYLDVVPVTRAASGALSLGGTGEPVEWTVQMRRMPREHLLDQLAAGAGLDDRLIEQVADAVAAMHHAAQPVGTDEAHGGGADGMRWIVGDNTSGLREHASLLDGDAVVRLDAKSRAALDGCAWLLDRRLGQGFVRHCHGDLHLGNLCLWDGRATVFDAIEFNDRFANIDVFYDLAFLVMELDRRVGRRAANLLINRYLRRTEDFEGLAVLPLYLSARAAIRAKVSAAGALAQEDEAQAHRLRRAAAANFNAALGYLAPPPARLIAVGGRSGSGKSTLARALAPMTGAAPGALHLRSDVIRKAMFGVEDEVKLPEAGYAPEASAEVYRRIRERAGIALRAGHSVVADAVYDRAEDRRAIAAVAADAGVRFDGVWLDVPPEVMRERLTARVRDASDATPAVLDLQLRHEVGALDWLRLSAAGPPDEVAARAEAALGLDAAGLAPDPDLRLQRGGA
ncbi:MAG: AAA family ATPase [Alphaproteobacteria bacterium]